jgi:hypothetical protein
MHVQRKTELRSRNRCSSGTAINILYSSCVPVALGIRHAMRVRPIILSCVLSGSTIFSHIISWTARFSGKSYWTQNVRFDFLYSICQKYFPFKKKQPDIVINVRWSSCKVDLPVILVSFNELEMPRCIFEKYSCQSSGKSVQWEPSWSMRTDG